MKINLKSYQVKSLFEKPIPAKGRLQIWKYDKGLSQIDYMDNKK